MHFCHYCGKQEHLRIDCKNISIKLPTSDTATNLLTIGISSFTLSTSSTSYLSTAATSNIPTTTNSNTIIKLSSDDIRKSQIMNYPKLEINNGCSPTDSQFIQPAIRIMTAEFRNQTNQKSLTSNILPATIIENESLVAIFPFEIEELLATFLFNRATLKEKPITTMYTDAKVNGHAIKLIFDSESADSIITQQLMNQLGCRVDHATSVRIIMADKMTKTPINKIDNFLFEVNSIVTPIKVLVIETTQYQALVELQLSQNDQHMRVPAICRHFKPITTPLAPLIKFEEEKKKPIWKAYQVSWTDEDHNKLSSIFS
ncbi:hypothetical protein G9A89_015774 [Geosiphon pyriformis]|nr:hypothetical protein G9A89_015774 [Geosiphon pyriformis]